MEPIEQRAADTDHEERRVVTGHVELRAGTADGSIGTIEGVASVVGQETVIGSGFWAFREMIMPGAFKDAVKSDDVRALFNHDPNLLLGRTASKTLRIKEDKSGLRYVNDLPDTATGRDVQTLIKRGDVNGSSFAFTVDQADEEWDESEVKGGKLPLRKILRISKLYDVSPVTYPAYPTTSVSARSRAKAANESVSASKEPSAAEAALAAANAIAEEIKTLRAQIQEGRELVNEAVITTLEETDAEPVAIVGDIKDREELRRQISKARAWLT